MKNMKIAAIVIGTVGVINALFLYACIRVGSRSDAHLRCCCDDLKLDDTDLEDMDWNWEDEMDGCE